MKLTKAGKVDRRTVKNRPKRPGAGYRQAGYQRFCGWCAKTTQVVTDGRMLVCGECGH